MKNDFKLFNNFNMNFNEYEEIPFTEEEKDFAKKIIIEKNKNNRYKYISIALIFIITLSLISINKNNLVGASKNYISTELKEFIFNNCFNNIESTNYNVNVKESSYDNDITVKLTDVIVSNNKILIYYIIDYSNFNISSYKDNFVNPKLAYNLKFFINDKPITNITTSTYKIDKYTCNSTLNLISVFNIDDIDLNSKINIFMSYDFHIIEENNSNNNALYPIHSNIPNYSSNNLDKSIIASCKFHYSISPYELKIH